MVIVRPGFNVHIRYSSDIHPVDKVLLALLLGIATANGEIIFTLKHINIYICGPVQRIFNQMRNFST